MPATFCHLHVHSQYSILDSTLSVSAIAANAKAFGMPAVALTDHGNLYGAIDFYKTMKEVGVTAIIGCEFNVAEGSRFEKKRHSTHSHLVLLAKDIQGYKNLCKLSSAGFLEGFYYVPRIDLELLSQHAEGLICLTGCEKGILAQAALKAGIAQCEGARDYVSRELLEDILEDAEEQIDALEAQIALVDQVGLPNYLQSQMGEQD